MQEVVTKGAYGHVTHGIFLYPETCTPHPHPPKKKEKRKRKKRKKTKGSGVFIYRILYVCQSKIDIELSSCLQISADIMLNISDLCWECFGLNISCRPMTKHVFSAMT